MGLPGTRPRAPAPAAAYSPERSPRGAADLTAAPPPTAAGNPLTPKRKCGPCFSDPQPAEPLAAPRAVRQPPPGQSALGPQAAPGAGSCSSHSPDSFFLSPIRVRLTRGVASRSANHRLKKVGLCKYCS